MAAVLAEAKPVFESAAAKLSTVEVAARHVFYIVHPFDRMTVEWGHVQLMAPELPDPELPSCVDGLWVLWAPDHLTAWSAATHRWQEMLFGAFDPDDPPDLDPRPAYLQQIEARFLNSISYDKDSPYLFGLTSEDS